MKGSKPNQVCYVPTRGLRPSESSPAREMPRSDGISNRVQHECAHQIAGPLYEFSNHALNIGKVPLIRKTSNVFSVLNLGHPSIRSN